MKRRTWTNKEKTAIMLEGLKGRLVNDICLEHQINQSLYYKWRDQFLSQAETLFEAGKPNKAEERLKQENARLKTCVAELDPGVKKKRLVRPRKPSLKVVQRNNELLERIRHLQAEE